LKISGKSGTEQKRLTEREGEITIEIIKGRWPHRKESPSAEGWGKYSS